MTPQQRIFKYLARDGECWHEVVESGPKPYIGKPFTCRDCGLKMWSHLDVINLRPNFYNWTGFGWANTRLKDKGLLNEFIGWLLKSGITWVIWETKNPDERMVAMGRFLDEKSKRFLNLTNS